MQDTLNFFQQGGVFMWGLLACSLTSVSIILWKCLTLKEKRTLPKSLEEKILSKKGEPNSEELNTVLGHLVQTAQSDQGEEFVEAAARKELSHLRAGLPALEVIITIAPLLGLLGTASGLAVVFQDFGDEQNNSQIAKGIAMALSTTITGLAVAVPSVIANSYFNRKVELYAARLEVILTKLIS